MKLYIAIIFATLGLFETSQATTIYIHSDSYEEGLRNRYKQITGVKNFKDQDDDENYSLNPAQEYILFCAQQKKSCNIGNIEERLRPFTQNDKDFNKFIKSAVFYYQIPEEFWEPLYNYFKNK